MRYSPAANTGLINRSSTGASPRWSARSALLVLAGLILGACGGQSQDPTAQAASNPATPGAEANNATGDAPAMEKGMYFKPEMKDFALHNEYEDDGDGDGVNETHVRRYINDQGDTAFSMTTNGTLWAWSLDTGGGDDTDIHKNNVIRDSNCDGVFDERYSLNAEFHVPGCLAQDTAADPSVGI
jgi:hypothetical protein